MRSMKELSARVRKQGGKVTPQRLAIWQALTNDKTHPTAEELYTRLTATMPTLSLATLYHVLNELVEWGEVRRFDTGDGHTHFDPDTTPHAELVCLRCHTVIDAPTTAYTAVALPSELAGYRIVTRSEQYFGYCPICQSLAGAIGDERII